MAHELKRFGWIAKHGRERYCKCCGGCCGCRTEGCVSGADIAVITLSGALTLASELLCEFLVSHGPQNWVTKALISSGASAFATFLVGLFVYRTKCAQAADGYHSDRDCAFYSGLIFSQGLAGAVTFGVGFGMDAITETSIPNHLQGDAVNTIVTPVLVALARGIFKTATTGVIGFFRQACCSQYYPKNYGTRDMLDADDRGGDYHLLDDYDSIELRRQ